MAAPTSYTEKTLAQFMQVSLGRIANALTLNAGPNDAGDFQEAVNDTLLLYGTESISDVTGRANIDKLRVLAKVAIWRYVVVNFAGVYDFSADGGSYSRSQLFKQAKETLALVEQQALVYDPTYAAKIVPLDQIQDPYEVWLDDDENSS